MTSQQTPGPALGPWDSLITELHVLRTRAGSPSYAELTRRVVERRVADGQEVHAARIAKSSVHDAFRFGRTRINVPLVRELVAAMDGDPAVVEDWLTTCATASAAPGPTPPDPGASTTVVASRTSVLLLVAACIALNLAGRFFVDSFHLPIYLDMAGTAIAAIALGPWTGAGVGVATNVLGVPGSGWISIPFALVNVAGALVWGYGVRGWGMGRTLPRFFALNVITAVTCSLVAVPILLALEGQEFRDGHELITEVLAQSVDQFVLALSFSNLIISLADKMISGFVALVVVSALPPGLRRGCDLVGVTEPVGRRE